MRILFWGTPDFAIPCLRALLGEGHHVVGVVTQPDRPAGRGRRLRASPVKTHALEEGLPVLTPERPRGDHFEEQLLALEPELSVVVAYGHILRPRILGIPPRGSINVHASLLPLLRGAAPVNWAVIRGHDRTGVTIMEMSEGMDEGPILLQREIPISPEDSATALYLRLSELGAEALIEALALMEAGLLESREQDHGQATYAPKVNRATARIDWSRGPRQVADQIRGMDMVPGAWTLLAEEPVKLFSPEVVARSPEVVAHSPEVVARSQTSVEDESPREPPAPGTILGSEAREGRLVVATGEGGAVSVSEAQPPGKRRMGAGDWLRGGGPEPGERFV